MATWVVESEPRGGPPRAHRRGRLLIALFVVGGLVGTVVAVAPPIAPHAFSGSILRNNCQLGSGANGTCSLPAQTASLYAFPTGSSVSLSWSSAQSLPVSFYVIDPHGQTVGGCSGSGDRGACSFLASAGSYEFNFEPMTTPGYTSEVDYQGTYTVPIL